MSVQPQETGGESISVERHLKDVFAGLRPLDPLDLVLTEAYGNQLADDFVAPFALPQFDQATVDGYAVKVDDVAAATSTKPVVLRVQPAGPVGGLAVGPGRAVRVGPARRLPTGTEAVVPVEWTMRVPGTGGAGRVTVLRAPAPEENLRRAGDDVVGGSLAMAAGTPLGAVQIATLALFGLGRVRVHPRPRVLVMATGEALLETGETYQNGHEYDGVSHALAAACREAGATPYRLPTARCTVDALLPALEDHLIQADVIVLSGPVRTAGFDPIVEMLNKLGSVTVSRVAMDPGGIQIFGRVGPERTPVFVLPAAPVAALVSFEVFVRPALRRLLGAVGIQRPMVDVTLTETLTSVPGRRHFARARVTHDADRGYMAAPLGVTLQTLTAFGSANALLPVPEDKERVAAGSTMPAILLERPSS